MPGRPNLVGANGPVPPLWNAIEQRIRAHTKGLAQVIANRTQGQVLDQYGNVVELWGTNLLQTVIIGSAFVSGTLMAGVQVSTGATNGTAGRITQSGLATGTITLTKGSYTATLDSTISGTFSNGKVIGAANVTDPTSGTATPAITPGTTMTISGSTITLSKVAAESGTALYCAACLFS